MKRICAVFIFSVMLLQCNFAQAGVNFKLQEASLATMIKAVAAATDTAQKRALNDEFCRFFEEVLQQPGAVKYAFKKIPYLYQVQSSDKRLRLITWSVPLGAMPHFFGFAMLRKGRFSSQCTLLKLQAGHTQPALTTLKTLAPNEWAGALYTQLIQRCDRKAHKTYYTLLGLRLSNPSFGSKVIDVATVSGDTLRFGAPIFSQMNRKRQRVVFEYNPDVVMKLEYNKRKKKIIFSSLQPLPGMPRSDFKFYFSSDSYDGYAWDGSCWIYEENVKLPNHSRSGVYVAPEMLPQK